MFVLHVVFCTSHCVLYFTLCFVLPVVFCTSRCVLHSEGNIKVSSTVRILYCNTQEFIIFKSNKYRTWFYLLHNINI